MDVGLGAEHLAAGWDALAGARWDAARDAFAAALAEEESPDALDGLGLAIWFLGEVKDGVAARERAFDGYVRTERCDDAARIAVWVSHQHLIAGRMSAARGWLGRAERAVEGSGPCRGQGWVIVERARHAESVEECAAHASRAMALGREHGDSDLEVFALSLLGRAEVDAGRKQHGMQLLEEALAAASAGRICNVHTLAEAYCNLITASTAAGDWELATEWCEMVDAFAREHGTTPLLGACRTIHAGVLVATGRWADAERALQDALAIHERHLPEMGAPTLAVLAELRVLQGLLPEAEQLLAGRAEHPGSLGALARLRIAQGQPEVAVALLERGLTGAADDVVRTMQLLAPLVDAHLACAQIAEAEEATARLAGAAGTSGVRLGAARADLAGARVAMARGSMEHAAESARRALAAFGALGMPLDAGEARLELARATAAAHPELARDEARAALAAFRELGAARPADAAAALLRSLGAGTTVRSRGSGELTAREAEVLGLLAQGMSNARLAQSLCITEKTAGHHVSAILAKLGVRNRAEAAAYAARAERATPLR